MTADNILHYKIQQSLGDNALYRTFEATHTQFVKKVCLKTPKNLGTAEAQAQWQAELRLLAQTQHPGIATFYDYWDNASETYIVLERVEGKDLAAHIREVSGPIAEAKARVWIAQLLSILDFAHSQGFVGGAINPYHVFVLPQGTLKITDEALSQVYVQQAIAHDDKETIAYLAPEQIGGGSPIDARTEVYALGVLMFKMLTGKSPYAGFNLGEIKLKIQQEPLPPVSKFYPAVSEGIQAIITKATAKQAADRYATVGEMLAALQALAPITPPKPETIQAIQQDTSPKSPKGSPIARHFVNMPLYALIGVSLLTIYLLVNALMPREAGISEVLFDIKNEGKIKQVQDSIAKAQQLKAINDSIRIQKAIKTGDTIIFHIHKVGKGENLERIAKRFATSLDSLKKWNKLTGKEKLKSREGIRIKVRAVHKVGRNESLEQIAAQYKVSPYLLKETNQLYPKPPKPGKEPEPVFYEGKDIVIPWVLQKQ